MSDITTQVKQEKISMDELDNLLGMPGAETVITASDNNAKPKFFSNEKVDLAFIDEPDDLDDPSKNPDDSKKSEDKVVIDDILNDLNDDPSKNQGGRPKIDKSGMVELTQSLFKDGTLLPFDDDKALEDYTIDDFKELINSNFKEKEKAIRESTPQEFFEALPHELQYAAKYVADGGTDLKGLFKALSQAEETKSLDSSTERGQETIVREYLRATNFGTDEEIQDEIESWKDLSKLEAKANQFKPKLDKMQEQILQRQIREQQERKEKQEKASMNYAHSIYDTLAKGDLNGIKLNNKVKSMLYQGLIQPNYPSISGNQTNLFGHLIEKHQFVEPNHELIAEALWLLADPEGYKTELRKETKNEAAKETARQLRFEQTNKNNGESPDDLNKGKERTPGIKRPNKNFFAR